MKTIYAYQTSDGKLFTDPKKAKDHQADIIGEMLDGLLPYDDRGNVTHTDRFNLLMKQLADPQLKDKINQLADALNFEEDEDNDGL